MFRYHPTFKFIQLHRKLSEPVEGGSDSYRLKTEDGIEVRKLYIKLLVSTVGCDEIEFLLSVYGPIETIKIFGKNVNSGWKMRNRGFVTFKNSCDASNALINRNTFSELFLLKPADTWNQPDYEKVIHGAFEEDLDESESTLFQMLNDDCLLHVVKFLDVLDVIVLRKVCKKFSELAEVHLKTVKSLNLIHSKLKKKLTLHEAKLVIEAVGKNVNRAMISSDNFYNRRVLCLLPKHLTNLKHLQLSGFKLESSSFWDQMTKILSSLESLDLSDNSEVDENFLRSFRKSKPNLKALNVSNCNVNGNFLGLLPNIVSLNISGCRYINGKQLIRFIELKGSLKTLNISKCPNISGRDVNQMLIKAPQITTLALNNYYIDDETSRFVIPSINPLINLKELTIQNINFPPCDQLLRTINLENCIEVLNISYGNLTLTSIYAISTMKHLKKLIMNFKNSVPEDLVDYLMELQSLEEIHISGCSYVSPSNVLRLFLLPMLRFLDISRCYGFTNEFITEAAERLKETGTRRRFQMLVGQTEIDHKVFETPEMKGHQSILELKWETTKDVEHDYDIDEENNKSENMNQQEYFGVDDIINILSNLDECDPSLVESIKKNL